MEKQYSLDSNPNPMFMSSIIWLSSDEVEFKSCMVLNS